MIPEAAVEAAAREVLKVTYPNDAEWDQWSEAGHSRLKTEARRILEAAAPHMLNPEGPPEKVLATNGGPSMSGTTNEIRLARLLAVIGYRISRFYHKWFRVADKCT